MGDTSDGDSSSDLFCRRVAPPSKRKMDNEIDGVSREITENEGKLKSLQNDIEGISTELKSIRTEKESKINKRQVVDRQLSALNAEITKKKDALAKLRSNLPYVNEQKINEAIRRLNRELQTRNFRLNEEKKIVKEIDSLNRSKRSLSQYLESNAEMNQLKERQKTIRDEGNVCHRAVSTLRTKETDLKSRRDRKRREVEEIKERLEELNKKKQEIVSDFRRREREYNDYKETREHKAKRMKEEEPKVKQDLKQIEIEEVEYTSRPTHQPFLEEKRLCETLITYLQRFYMTVTPNEPEKIAGTSGSGDSHPIEQDGMYVLQKKRDEGEEKYGGAVRRTSSKKTKRDRSKKIQKVKHTLEIIAQFDRLNLHAPSNLSEVPISIEQLEGQKRYYETASPTPAPNNLVSQSESSVGPGGDSSAQKELNFVETSAVAEASAEKVEVSFPPIQPEDKSSQGSDDVFFDESDDVFDANQNIPTERKHNFFLISSRDPQDMKPLGTNVDFLADAIRNCHLNGFVNPYDNSDSNTLDMAAPTSNKFRPMSNHIETLVEDVENGNASDDDLDSLVQESLSEIKMLGNCNTSDIDIEPSTDSSDMMDSIESTDTGVVIVAPMKGLPADEEDTDITVIFPTDRPTLENLDASCTAEGTEGS